MRRTSSDVTLPIRPSASKKMATRVPGTTAEPVRRPSEIEDATNLYFVHPIASRLLPLFAAMHVHPNAVSVAGMAFGVLAGVAYSHYQDLQWTIAGFVLMVAWHVMDGADGQLARLTHSQSQAGKVLDGACDYVTFAAVYVGLALPLSRQYGGWVWGVVAVSGICHAVQSAAYEKQREDYSLWAWDRKPVAPAALRAAASAATGTCKSQLLADALYRPYARIQLLIAGAAAEFHSSLAAALETQPEQARFVRERYREVFAPTVRRWSVLSANYRTLGIFVCALAKHPLWYFWLEIVGFNAILIVLLYRQRARRALFLKGLDRPASVAICMRGDRDGAPVP